MKAAFSDLNEVLNSHTVTHGAIEDVSWLSSAWLTYENDNDNTSINIPALVGSKDWCSMRGGNGKMHRFNLIDLIHSEYRSKSKLSRNELAKNQSGLEEK